MNISRIVQPNKRNNIGFSWLPNSDFFDDPELSPELTQQMKEIWKVMLGDVVQEAKIVSSCKYSLQKMLITLNNAPSKRAARYVAWRMLYQLLQYFGAELQKFHLHFVSKLPEWDYTFKTPWQECSDVLRKELGLAVFKVLLDAGYIQKERIQEVEDLFLEVKKYFIRAVRSFDWFGNNTRKTFLTAIKKMEFDPGYPQLILESGVLDHVYNELLLEDTYFHSMMNIKKFKTRHSINRLWYSDPENPISLISLEDNPLGSNSKYSYIKNTARIDISLLRPPVFFYSENIPKYLTYGEASFLVRQMSHALDITSIRNVNGTSLNEDQMLQSLKQKYNLYTTCLSNQTVQRQNVLYPEFFRTELLDKLITDMGSFVVSYINLVSHLQHLKKQEFTLPGISLTKKQTYFVQVAQKYCNLRNNMSTSLHDGFLIPERIRVNIAISNIKAFGSVFNCPSNSYVNPEIKCDLFST